MYCYRRGNVFRWADSVFSLMLIYHLHPFRHRDKDTEFVTLCKSLRVTDLVCDHAWTLWKTIQDSLEELEVCDIQPRLSLQWKPKIMLHLYNNYHYNNNKTM